jgi:abortive infection bacteriophage resistance protein
MKKYFSKPSLTIQEQIALLEHRGIKIQDKEKAAHSLRFIGYYRLSGYTHYFKTAHDLYSDKATWDAILNHYTFDSELRILLFESIKLIEVATKSAITSVMTDRYGPFWFNNNELFVNHLGSKIINGGEFIQQAIRESTVEQKNKDVFLKHYYDTYAFPDIPPSWVVMETLSMGIVSKMLSLLKVETRKEIAILFKTKERHLVSWIRSLTYTRNLCAHHARIWNRIFTLKVEADKRYAICREEAFYKGRIYSQMVVIWILLQAIDPANPFEQDIKDILRLFPHDYATDMGFPKNWDGFKF